MYPWCFEIKSDLNLMVRAALEIDGPDFGFSICRAVGTGEPLFNMNSGRLQASLDRVEAIFSQ